MTIRPARTDDYRGTEELVRDAFWDLYRPGVRRNTSSSIKPGEATDLLVDLVAADSPGLLGSLIVTRAQIIDADGHATEVGYLGPIGVSARSPTHRNRQRCDASRAGSTPRTRIPWRLPLR